MTLREYAGSDFPYDMERAKYFYRKYKKLTQEQKDKIESLKSGQLVKYQRGTKTVDMIVMCVTTDNANYKSYPYDIRLNYSDYKTNFKREWEGFWTMNIDKIIL